MACMKTIFSNKSNNITESLNLRNYSTTRTKLKTIKQENMPLSPIETILMAQASFLLSVCTILYVILKTDPTHARYKETSDD